MKKQRKLTYMEAALRQPALQGTISEEKWDSLHTIEELDLLSRMLFINIFKDNELGGAY